MLHGTGKVSCVLSVQLVSYSIRGVSVSQYLISARLITARDFVLPAIKATSCKAHNVCRSRILKFLSLAVGYGII